MRQSTTISEGRGHHMYNNHSVLQLTLVNRRYHRVPVLVPTAAPAAIWLRVWHFRCTL